MSIELKSRDRKQLVWPAAGILLGFLVGIQPFRSGITMQTGIAAWCVSMGLVLILAANPIGARIGALQAGMFLAVPCVVWSTPLGRGLLMCGMCAPVVAAAALVQVPPIAGVRKRVAYMLAWSSKCEVSRRARSFDTASLLQLAAATLILAAGIAAVKAIPASGLWLPARWFAGGIMVLAYAEMITAGLPLVSAAFGLTVPQLMQSPWRSVSIGEFWTKRWNIFASQKVFRPYFFAPLARRSAALALVFVFFASGLAHAMLAFMAIGKWGLSLCCGVFFVVQPLLIAAERWMKVRRWRPAAGWMWTLAALTLTSPLFVEPALQIIESSWGRPGTVLPPALAALGFVLALCGTICGSITLSAPANTLGELPGNQPGAASDAAR